MVRIQVGGHPVDFMVDTSLQGPGVLPGSTGYREAPKGGAERCGRKEERQVKTQRRYCAVRWSQGEMLARGSRRDKKAHLLERRQL